LKNLGDACRRTERSRAHSNLQGSARRKPDELRFAQDQPKLLPSGSIQSIATSSRRTGLEACWRLILATPWRNTCGRHIWARALQSEQDGYVQRHFDEFAETFDSVLSSLEYSGPTLWQRALAHLISQCNANARTCWMRAAGTGLAASSSARGPGVCRVESLAKHASRAEQRNVYDELKSRRAHRHFLSRAVACQSHRPAPMTFDFFGDLREVPLGAQRALATRRVRRVLPWKLSSEEHSAGYQLQNTAIRNTA